MRVENILASDAPTQATVETEPAVAAVDTVTAAPIRRGRLARLARIVPLAPPLAAGLFVYRLLTVSGQR